jgi:hypothetical protein
MKQNTCKTCASWERTSENSGECRYEPPVVDPGTDFTAFPETQEDCWCRKYEKMK